MFLPENDKFWCDLMETHYLIRRADKETCVDFNHDGPRTFHFNQFFNPKKNHCVKYFFHVDGVFKYLIDFKHTGSRMGFHNGGFTRRAIDMNDVRDRFLIMLGHHNEADVSDFVMSFIMSHGAGR